MKAISSIVLGVGLLSLNTAQALECEVRYKAKKTVTEKFLLQRVKTQKFKAGKARGRTSGNSMKACEKNALQPLRDRQWKITSHLSEEI